MAKASIELIEALRRTASKLERGEHYEWGHMGSCNCGHLAQELTPFSRAEIHQFAMQKSGDWSEQVEDYCPSSGYPMDLLITALIDAGLSQSDLKYLERLSDPKVIDLVGHKLKFNRIEDTIQYFRAWANLLEMDLIEQISITFEPKPQLIPVLE